MMGYNYMANYGGWGNEGFLGLGFGLIALLIVWSLYWKGTALWTAAKNNQKEWFIALLIINTAGLLEIFYLYVIAKKKESK